MVNDTIIEITYFSRLLFDNRNCVDIFVFGLMNYAYILIDTTEISRTLGGLFPFAPSDLKGQSADFRLIFGWLSFLRLLYQFSFPPNNLFDTLEREDVHDGFEYPQGQRG
jgi:hypothetical protein